MENFEKAQIEYNAILKESVKFSQTDFDFFPEYDMFKWQNEIDESLENLSEIYNIDFQLLYKQYLSDSKEAEKRILIGEKENNVFSFKIKTLTDSIDNENSLETLEELEEQYQESKERAKLEGEQYNRDMQSQIAFEQEFEEAKINAGKIATDENFKYLLTPQELDFIETNIYPLYDEGFQYNDYLNNRAESGEKFVYEPLKPIPLTIEDLENIANRWQEEINNTTKMSDKMTVSQIAEKVSNYYSLVDYNIRKQTEKKNAQDKEEMKKQQWIKENQKRLDREYFLPYENFTASPSDIMNREEWYDMAYEDQVLYKKKDITEENQQEMIGGTVKELAGKTLTDNNYQFLFDEGTRNAINAYIEANPTMEKVDLSGDDYNHLYTFFEEKNPITNSMSDSELIAIQKHYGDIFEQLYNEYQQQIFQEDNDVSLESSNNLPEGWRWRTYDDGSGSLVSPENKNYFNFDSNTNEYKDINDNWNLMSDGFDFKGYAETMILKNGLKDTLNPPLSLEEKQQLKTFIENQKNIETILTHKKKKYGSNK